MIPYRLDMVEIRDKRKEVNINPENPFFFAQASESSTSHLRSWDTLNKMTQTPDFNLKQPKTISSNHLRKYVATVSQILDLQEKELDWLARHMGHDIQVHREYYRLHESTLELAKVSKILSVVDEGNFSKYAGKSLNEIEVELPDGKYV